MAKTADQWFAEYGESHRNPTNKAIHWVAVPVIFTTIIGLLWSIPTPAAFDSVPYLNWATLALVVTTAWYVHLSPPLGIGMGLFSMLMVLAISAFEQTGLMPVWAASLLLFVIMWILQFVGHHIEGKKPSFFKDIQFLLIGPAWLMGFIYRSLGIRY
ncbi:Mpo1 family 2-hydroxy fatty acid dioxygenase [Marinobacter fonticola]|uniref:Mpo1 family 2-hydroxy fatty acid dioxygenase n=1 Tax=Marinobacter fonticola TaxID=2603215 RepID=UPI0011E82944|nr:Mpo1-like protein [Marinobacter fonticola]